MINNMKFLKVYYVKELLNEKGFTRDIENFPLKPKKHRLKKHPFFSFSISDYSNNKLTFYVKNNKYIVHDGCYTFVRLKKTDKYQFTVFFEIVEEKVEGEIKDDRYKKS